MPLLALLTLLGSASAADSDITINELIVDLPGSDTNQEWLELYNRGPDPVDVSGWSIEWTSGTSSSSRQVPASTVVPAKGWITIGGSASGADVLLAEGNGFSFFSGASNSDAVFIGNGTVTIDSVIYGSPNNDAISMPDSGSTLAPAPGVGESLGRKQDGVDSNDNAQDWEVFPVPSPGLSNQVAGDTDTHTDTDVSTHTDVSMHTGDTGGGHTGSTDVPQDTDTDVPVEPVIVINEFLPDASGSDDGKEFVEILNVGGVSAALDGWQIASTTTGSSWTVRYTLPSVVLAPGERWTVCGEQLSGCSVHLPGTQLLSLPNASSNADAIRLTDGATVYDTVVYGTPNSTAIQGDGGSTATAPSPVADRSLSRVPDGSDTDDSSVDFRVTTPTPQAPNPGADSDTDLGGFDTDPTSSFAGQLVINEFVADVTGADGGYEWVELASTAVGALDLAGFVLERSSNGTSWSTAHEFTGGSLPEGGYLVVGDEFVLADVIKPTGEFLSLSNASSSADAIRLLDPAGDIVDTVVYGPNNDDGIVDDQGQVASPAPKPVADQSLSRFPDKGDTDDSSVDFQITAPTLGSANVGVTCGDPASAAAGLVINELMPDPSGSPDDGNEWVELYNGSAATLDLSGWAINAGTSSFGALAPLPQGTVLAPGAFVAIVQSAAALPGLSNAVLAPGFSLGNASSSNADAVRIEDCDGMAVDTVVYGGDNSGDEWLDDTGAVATSLAPTASSGVSLARIVDGGDTQQSGVDFQYAAFPTPGASNTAAPPDCGALGSGLVINEFLPDPSGEDEGNEWLELYHGGTEALDLDGWALQAGASSYTTRFAFEGSTPIAPGGRLLIGGEGVPGTDYTSHLGLGNASNADAVRLVDCNGVPADTVVYGSPNSDQWLDDTGSVAVSLAPKAGGGDALARIQDGYDTDQSAHDFVATGSPTPGAPNPVVEAIVCVGSDGAVVLNELLPDPDGTDEGFEWIELYNSSSEAKSVAGWQLAIAGNADTNSFSSVDVVLGGQIEVPAQGFLVIGEDRVSEADVVVGRLGMGNGGGGDGVRLFDCQGTPVDTAVYGDEGNEDGIVDDNDSVVEALPDPGSNQAVARIADGVDSDDVADWKVDVPTPGATNVRAAVDGPDDIDAPGGGCGCRRGAPDGEAPAGEAPDSPPTGTGSCSTSPLPFGGIELLLGWLVLARRRRG